MFTVYTMSYGNDLKYVGMTKDLYHRKAVHKSRFLKKSITGSYYPVYVSLRKLTKNFNNLSWEVLKTFDNKEDAKLYESKMINKIGILNTRS